MDGDMPTRQRVGKGFLLAEEEENSVEALLQPISKGRRRPSELKAKGVELHEILGGQTGAAFICDHCDGDHKVAYAAFGLVYSPTAPNARWKRRAEGTPSLGRGRDESNAKAGAPSSLPYSLNRLEVAFSETRGYRSSPPSTPLRLRVSLLGGQKF